MAANSNIAWTDATLNPIRARNDTGHDLACAAGSATNIGATNK